MSIRPSKTGVALSGGGYRATAFHLGTLKKLHEMGILKEVDVISTISGGSITGACYCSRPGDFDSFYTDLYNGLQQKNVIRKILFSWLGLRFLLLLILLLCSVYFLFTCRGWIFLMVWIGIIFTLLKFQFQLLPLSKRIEQIYDIFFYHKSTLGQLHESPTLVIGSTNLQTAKPFSFSKYWMQDSTYQFMDDPVKFKAGGFPLARAVMASSCVPFAFTPVTIDAACLADLNAIVTGPANRKAKPLFYRGRIFTADRKPIDTVAIALKDLYNNKCAYCEKYCYYPRVEHYRPKGRVTGANPSANGYYWLSYEWTNLLPSCHECNSVEAKGDKFPVNGLRKMQHATTGAPPLFDRSKNDYASDYLTPENPVYIHPEYCIDFFQHFDFDKTGRMTGLTHQGFTTVEELKLSNETLNGLRREIYNNHLTRLEKIIFRFSRPVNPRPEEWLDEEITEWVSDLVKESLDHELQFTLFRKILVRKIDVFFIQAMNIEFQPMLRKKIADALMNL